jgi:hypothetical protein
MTNLLAIQLHQVEWNETCMSLAPSVSLELLVAVQLEPKSGNAVTRHVVQNREKHIDTTSVLQQCTCIVCY